MQENPPRKPCKNRTRKDSRSKSNRPRKSRFSCEETADSVDCTGEYCRSCAASLLADCVAVCCCPLALVSFLALAFVKVPYLVGRRCWQKRKKLRKCKKVEGCIEHDMVMYKDVDLVTGRLSWGKSDIVFEFGDEDEIEERKSFCAAFEADKVLMELYQIGHLGFGRVSFTGIQSFADGN
ncbi:hypothetical protein RND81_04G175700 [Saponaria officinalis]|uniref:Uncharacterized protein n=1 Tax=Saponaria officinalis TaxID=3572 RepID=A0AAW1LFI7_SAPOF